MKITILFVLYFIPHFLFSQNHFSLTGDWILPQLKGSLLPIQIIKLEYFSAEDYIGSLESENYPLSLYKARKLVIDNQLFFDGIWLKEGQEDRHYYWLIQNVFKDSAKVCLLNNSSINLGDRDIIDNNGQIQMIDTSKIDFELIYSISDIEFIEKDNSWIASPKSQQVVFLSKNPLLFEFLIKKYGAKITKKCIPLTYYRWSFFTWNKVNSLNSNDIISVIRLDRRAVHDIFETASIEDLMQFKIGKESVEKIRSLLNNYHLVRDNSIGFLKSPNYWIFEFKGGYKLKIKTNLWERGLYDATNHKLYKSKNSLQW